jgi:hypothetical protein
MPLFRVIFTDNSQHLGGNLSKQNWVTIPNDKKIKALLYNLPTGDHLCLEGYSKYYLEVEVSYSIMSNGSSNFNGFTKTHLTVKRNNQYLKYSIDLKTSAIEVKVLSETQVNELKLNPIYWRRGV